MDQRDAERVARIERATAARVFYGELARELGGTYTPISDEPFDARGHITVDGRRLFVSTSTWAGDRETGRVEISGSWPDYRDGRGHMRGQSPRDLWNPKAEAPSITCAMSRGAANVAKDIQRRFLPAFIEVYDRLQARAVEIERAAAGVRTRAETFARAYGGHGDTSVSMNGTHAARVYTRPGLPMLEVRDGYVKFDVSVNDDLARRILDMLADHAAREERT